ncbi:MAG: ATP-binding protein [Pyrobaculum sp.]
MALELVKSLGLFSHGIVIVYGASGVGKTTLTLAVMRELQTDKLYIASEPNVFYGDRLKTAAKYAQAEYVKDLPEAFRKALQFVQKNKHAFVAIDSVSAFAQHEAARRMVLEGEMPQPLAIVGSLSFAANAMAQALAEYAIRQSATIWLIAQERPAIGKTWRGEDAAPSFAMRALHSVLAVARLIYTTHGRILRVVMHRDPNYEKKQAEVPSITL